jgi:hypothetical protein
MESVLQDLRITARQLLKNKSFRLTAILSLALGIGATTAVFSVVYGVLLDPYPYKDNNRMVHIQLLDKNGAMMALLSLVMVQPRREACSRSSASCISGSCPLSVDTRAYSATRLIVGTS